MTAIHKKEPLVLIGLLGAGVVFLAGHFGIVLDHATVQGVLEPLVISLLGRPFVTPAIHKVVDTAETVVEDPHSVEVAQAVETAIPVTKPVLDPSLRAVETARDDAKNNPKP